MKSKIHVNQHHIRANRVDGGQRPVFTVKTYKENRRGNEVVIHGPSRLIYQPNNPLSCGARAWIETESEVEVY